MMRSDAPPGVLQLQVGTHCGPVDETLHQLAMRHAGWRVVAQLCSTGSMLGLNVCEARRAAMYSARISIVRDPAAGHGKASRRASERVAVLASL
jgi:hypothetical protein